MGMGIDMEMGMETWWGRRCDGMEMEKRTAMEMEMEMAVGMVEPLSRKLGGYEDLRM